MERYLIGEVSKITGISKDTLHFYDKIGLLSPDYMDPKNHYRYYSRWNLWQLDIISMCRKLSIPLEQVKKVLGSQDNGQITELLLGHRENALALSRYYQQVADDILWYESEYRNVSKEFDPAKVWHQWFDAETVIAGSRKREAQSYHADLQEAALEQLQNTGTIRRKYGYVLDLLQAADNHFIKKWEYLKLDGSDHVYVKEENKMVLPAGEYLVCKLYVSNETADFSPLFQYIREHRIEVDFLYAEEIGLQLFQYLDHYACLIRAHIKE